jgi:HTH-type transcriptional regulator/antitoxin HigA
MLTSIKTDADYKVALREIEQLIDSNARAGTPAGDRLGLLTLLVEDYERRQIQELVVDPVEAIKFRMEQMNLSPRDLVPLIGSRSKVSEILSRKRPLTLSMVRALNKGLGIPAKSLVQEQSLFALEEDAIDWSRFPIEEMISRGWIEREHSLRKHPKLILNDFFSVLGSGWTPAAFYKRTQYIRSARTMDQYALTAWKARVCQRALSEKPATTFDREKLDLGFLNELSHLSTLQDGPRHCKEYLAAVGISFIVEPQLSDTYLDGAAMLLMPDHPIVALTLRHDRVDNFWFVLMHELVHVWKHLNNDMIVVFDDLDVENDDNEQEREADLWAGEALIPSAEWSRSPARSLRTPEAAEHLARKLRIHPAIVAGRIRHQYKSYRVLNRHVGQGEVRRLFPEALGLKGK